MSDGCYECMRNRVEELRRLKTEKECFALAKEIYAFLAEHKGSVLEGKKVTFKIPKRVEAKNSGEKQE